MDSLTVNVVTPNGLVYDHHAKKSLWRKTTDGEIGILPKTCANHRSASD